jgi:CRISPR/Cas system-associated exonuclease Cas4 (RecB family)
MSQGTLIEGCPDTISPVYDALKKEITVYACHSNWASEIGNPCELYLVYLRTRWEERLLTDVKAHMRMRQGKKVFEKIAADYLEMAGFEIIEQSRPFSWRKYNITGKLDFKIFNPIDKKIYPVEVKGISPFDFDKINCIEDMLLSKKSWFKKYPAQLTSYLLMDGKTEFGLFYIINKLSYEPKQIWMQLNYTYGEELILKAERINNYVKNEAFPIGINDPDICQYCGFLHICLPEMIGKEIEIIDEVTIEETIKRCEELKPMVSEYNKLDKQWKKALEGKEKVMIGEYLITGKWIERKGYTVEDSRYWQSKILIKPKGRIIGESV